MVILPQNKLKKMKKKMETRIYLKNGSLTSYAFSCGRIQKHESFNFEVQLYMEHGIYHLRFINITEFSRSVDFWQCFERLDVARKLYNKFKKSGNFAI